MEHKDLLSGFVRLHILHHASEHEIYGLWIIEELARHGYRLSSGTLYPNAPCDGAEGISFFPGAAERALCSQALPGNEIRSSGPRARQDKAEGVHRQREPLLAHSRDALQ